MYATNRWIGVRFIQCAKFLIQPEIPRFTEEREISRNIGERIANKGLYLFENAPRKISELTHSPRWITSVFTLLADFGVTFAFYPDELKMGIRWAIAVIPLPTLAQLKFTSWVTLILYINLIGLRAFSRAGNAELMENFYKDTLKHKPIDN